MSWPVVVTSGGPRERGRAYGSQAAERIGRSIELYEAIFRLTTGLSWPEVRARSGAFVEAIDAYDVRLLPEMEGIAEGAAVDAEDVLALNLRTEVMYGLATARECTAIALAPDGAQAHTLIGQNWDWKPAARETCVVLIAAPDRGPAFATFVEAGLLAKCGMNESGIGLVTNALVSSKDRGDPGVPFHAILRRILTSSDLDEAIAVVTDGPRASSANYLIGSADGRIADLETAPGGAESVHRVEGVTQVHTNHFLWEERPFKDVGRIDGESTLRRQRRALAAVQVGAPDLATLQASLTDHEGHPGSVCGHRDPVTTPEEDHVTIASIAMDLNTSEWWLTEGPPCDSPYEWTDIAAAFGAARGAGSGARLPGIG